MPFPLDVRHGVRAPELCEQRTRLLQQQPGPYAVALLARGHALHAKQPGVILLTQRSAVCEEYVPDGLRLLGGLDGLTSRQEDLRA